MVGVLALVVPAGVLVGCGTKEPSKQDLSDALVDSGLSRKVSDCVAKAVLDTLSPDEVSRLVQRGSGGAPTDDPKRSDDSADKLREAMSRCRTLQGESTTTTAPPATSSTVAPSTVPVSDDASFDTSTP